MSLAVVRSLDALGRLAAVAGARGFRAGAGRPVRAGAASGAGMADSHVAGERSVVFDFIRFLGRPVWTAGPEDADRFLVHLRRDRGLAATTVQTGWAAGPVLRLLDRPLPGRHSRA